MQLAHFHIFGATGETKKGDVQFGPLVVYSLIHNQLKFIDAQISIFDPQAIEHIHRVASGKEKASLEGAHVFNLLRQHVAEMNLQGDGDHDT